MCAVGCYEVRSDVSVTRNARELPSPAEHRFRADEGGTRSAARTRSPAMWVPTLQQASVTLLPPAISTDQALLHDTATCHPVTCTCICMSGSAISRTNIFGINTFTAIVDLSRFNNSCLKSPSSTLVDLTFQSRALRSFSLNQLCNLSF